MVAFAMEAAESLREEGINAEVINIHTIKPLDSDIIVSSARKTGAVVTCEEHSVIGGLGSAVCEALSEACPTPTVRVGVQDLYGRSGKVPELLDMYGLTPRHIKDAAKRAISLKK
jgi:transketolase